MRAVPAVNFLRVVTWYEARGQSLERLIVNAAPSPVLGSPSHPYLATLTQERILDSHGAGASLIRCELLVTASAPTIQNVRRVTSCGTQPVSTLTFSRRL